MFYKLAVNSVLHRIVYNDVHTFLNRFCPRSWTVFALDNRHFMDEHGFPPFSPLHEKFHGWTKGKIKEKDNGFELVYPYGTD